MPSNMQIKAVVRNAEGKIKVDTPQGLKLMTDEEYEEHEKNKKDVLIKVDIPGNQFVLMTEEEYSLYKQKPKKEG